MTELEVGLKPQELLIENPRPVARKRRVVAARLLGGSAVAGVAAVLLGMNSNPMQEQLSLTLDQAMDAVESLKEDPSIAEAAAESGQTVEKMTQEFSDEYHARVAHAKELLGKYYDRSVVRHTEDAAKLDSFIRKELSWRLKGKWKAHSRRIQKAILEESRKHGFDPLFLMAVIENESSFRVDIVGGVGEIGLMQLRPSTAKWIARKFDLEWNGNATLLDPVANIRLGAAYLAFLRKRFDSHGRLYLAAYNMGSQNVKRALGKNVWPKDYPSAVMNRYIKLYTELKETITTVPAEETT